MRWPNQGWPNSFWASGRGATPGPPPTGPPAVKVFSFDAPTGIVGSSHFLPLDFLPRLLLLFGNGRSESVNTVGQKTLLSCNGVATGLTEQFCSFGMISDNVSPGRVRQGVRDDSVFAAFEDSASVAVAGRLKVSSWSASGIAFEVTQQFAQAQRICGIVIGGALQAKAMTIAEPASTGVETYTGVGFQPDQAFFLMTQVSTPNTETAAMMNTSFGMVLSPARQLVVANLGTAQGSVTHGGRSGTKLDRCLITIDGGADIDAAQGELTEFNADGFKINWSSDRALVAGRLYVAVLMEGNYQVSLNTLRTPTGSGQLVVAGMGKAPDAVMLLGGGKAAEIIFLAGHATQGAFSDLQTRWALGEGIEENNTAPIDSYTGIRFDDCYLRITAAGAITNRLDIETFHSNGYTLRSEAWNGAQYYFYSWAWVDIGEGQGAAVAPLCLETDPGLQPLTHDPDWSDGIRERTGFLTDILPGYTDAEQRVQLRRHPRVQLGYSLALLDARETGLLEALAWGWQGNRFAVPLWQDATALNADVSPGAISIQATTVFRRFTSGAWILLWRDPHTYELLRLGAVNPTSLELNEPALKSWAADGRTWVLPAFAGRLTDEQSVEELADFGSRLELNLELEYQAGLEPPAGSPTQYQGYDVLEVEPGSPRAHTLTRNRFRLDSGSGAVYTLDRSKRPVLERDEFFWLMLTRSEVETFRQFVWARKGALTPFWVPTWQHDLILAADVGSGETDISILLNGYTQFMFPHIARRHLAILLNDGSGTKLCRKVTAAVEADPNETLTISSAPGIALPKTATKLSFLVLCRLAEDDPEMVWNTTEIAEARLSFTELPAEAP